MKKRSLLFLLITLMILSFVAIPVSANNGEGETYEVAMLIDVSGSMNQADPNRVSIEAARSFAAWVSSQAQSFKISVILYNTEATTALESVDVMTEKGRNSYQSTLATISELGKNGKFNGFTCWAQDTDIGSAIKQAESILTASKAQKKSVILFTDGKIDLDNDFSVTTSEEKRSENDSFTCAANFAKAGIPMYTIGLNYNNGVDKTYMQKLADTTGGRFLLCTNANEISKFFQEIFADVSGGTSGEGDDYDTKANVETVHTEYIYGQAIREANLVLSSTAVINHFKVVNPSGVVVAEGTTNGTETASVGCYINRTDYTVNIKLVSPADGEWKVSFTSKTDGKVRLGKIFQYNLEVVDDSQTSAVVGSTVELAPALFNSDTDSRITTQAIYENSKCTVMVSHNGTTADYNASLNSAKNGYKLPLKLDTPGDYEITYKITNAQFEVEGKRTLTALQPKLVLSTDTVTCERNQAVKIVCKLQDPQTSKEIALPAYLTDFTLTAEVTLDGQKLESLPVKYTADGEISFTYTPEKAGDYQISATISRYNDTITADNAVNFTVWQPQMTLVPEKNEVGRGENVKVSVKFLDPATSEEIAMPDYLSDFAMTVKVSLDGNLLEEIPVTSADGDGIRFTYKPLQAGEYSITATLVSGDMTIDAKEAIAISVGQPTFEIVTEKSEYSITDGDVVVKMNFFDAEGNTLDTYPDYMADYTVTFTAGGKTEDAVTVSEFVGGGAKFTYSPAKAGDHTVLVVVAGNGETIEQEITFTVKPSSISLEEDLEDIEMSTLSGEIVKEYDLDEIFSDSDGDDLKFEVSSDSDDIDVDLDGETLIVTAKRGASGSLTIKVSDGKGAEKEVSFNIEIKSMLPLLITCIVAVLVIAVATVVFILIVRKRQIVRMAYRIRITIGTDSAVYGISRAASNRKAKRIMTLKEIFNSTLAMELKNEIDEDELEAFISQNFSKISITGFAFKKGIKITQVGEKAIVFEDYMKTIKFKSNDEDDSDENSICFGRSWRPLRRTVLANEPSPPKRLNEMRISRRSV